MKPIFKSAILLAAGCFWSLYGISANKWTAQRNYQYDMRAYLSVILNNEQVKDMSTFEIAAFCGDECRGVAEVVELTPGLSVAYIAIGSDSPNGDKITFSLHHKTTDRNATGLMPLTFESNALKGSASTPLTFKINVGDVNGDEKISISDITELVEIVKGKKEQNMMSDINDDGVVDIKDVFALANLIITTK